MIKYILIFTAFLHTQNLCAQPTISSFTPTSGYIGTIVTITGTNFNATATNNIVFFGATKAIVNTASTYSLNVSVPTGATYQYISVTDLTTGLTAYSEQPFITTFSCGGIIDTNSFATKVDFATGIYPSSIAIGDLDGDGKPDLAIANMNSNSVSLLRNTSISGTISFAPKIDFVGGNLPVSLAIGDLDGDGKPELAIADYYSINGISRVSVLRNTSTIGTIGFAPIVQFLTGAGSWSVAICDLDRNGKPDLAVANQTANTVSVLRNTSTLGTISFATKVDFATGTQPKSVAIGDLDGDSKPDLALANRGANTVSVLRNTCISGTIAFAPKMDFATGSQPWGLEIGDLNEDDKPDIAIANFDSNSVSLLPNTSISGTISFAPKIDFTTGALPWGVAIGAMDGDSKPDLAMAGSGSPTVSVLRNTGTSGIIAFAPKVNFTSGNDSWSPAIGDLDADDKPDLIVANFLANTISILKNQIHVGPTMTSSNTATICSGNAVEIPLTSNLNSTYNWVASNNLSTSGESITNQSGDTLSNTLTNITSSTQIVSYTVTPTCTIGGCVGTPQNISVTVISLSQPASGLGATLYCAGNATITATPATGGTTIKWYSASSSGTLLNTGLSYSAIFDSTTILYAATYNSTTGCESVSRIPVIVTFASLNQPTSGSGASICSSGSATISAIPATGGTHIHWYSASSGGTLLGTSLSYSATYTATTTLYAASYNATTFCESSARLPVIVTVADLNQPIVGVGDAICGSGTGIISAVPASGGTTINWYGATTGGVPVYTGLSYSAIYSSTTIIYSTTYNSSTGCESAVRIPITIVVYPLPIITSTITNADYGDNGTATITVDQGTSPYIYDWSMDGTGDFDDTQNQTGLTAGNYTLVVSDQHECKDTTDITIENADELLVTTGISPNGDGLNDVWAILGTNQFEDLKVSVFNLIGRCVYNQQGKYIPWNGLYNGVLAPVGDYYYVIESIIKKKKLTGALTVKY